MKAHIAAGLWALGALLCPAQTATTSLSNGDPANRVDIAIVGDGYTAAERAKFDTDAAALSNFILAAVPFAQYKSYFNVHNVFVASTESGADHPELNPPVMKNTAFDATYNCSGIVRLICVTNSKVTAALSAAGLAPNQRETTMVLVNDSVYGGSGGAIAVTSTNVSAPEILAHELGHSFGLLTDEYTTNPPPCNLTVEPTAVNATRETVRENLKWKIWVEPTTAIPTPGAPLGLVGLFTGSDYCPTGKFRPTYDSKMRSLGRPFEQINSEQLVKRIYNVVSPIDSVDPPAGAVTGASRTYTVMTPSLPSGFRFEWRVDGQPVSQNPSFVFTPTGDGVCPQEVSLSVSDPTPLVRTDPSLLLWDTRTWAHGRDPLNGPPASLQGIVNAASAAAGRPLAPNSWVSLFGGLLAPALTLPGGGDLPTSIDGVIVRVIDSAGVARIGRLQFVSPGQINFILPPETAVGAATIQVCRPGGFSQRANITVARTAPGIFTANSSGAGVAAAYVLRVAADGTQTQSLVFGRDASQRIVTAPIALTPESDQLYLILFGTGLRNPADPARTVATVAGASVPVLFAGAQGEFDALDQVNIGPLPASIRSPGLKNIVIQVDGVNSNTVQVELR